MDPASLFLLPGGQAMRQGRAGAPSPTPYAACAPCQIEDRILENKTRGLDTIGFIEASADGSACGRKVASSWTTELYEFVLYALAESGGNHLLRSFDGLDSFGSGS